MKTLKHTTLALITLLLTLLLGCSKKNETSVTVIVYEKGTNIPVVGLAVDFGYSSSGGVFSGSVIEQTKTTNASGRVSFKSENPDESYGVGFTHGTDYFGESTTLKQGKNNPVVLYLYPHAYVRVHAKNVNPYDNNDWINISNGDLGGGGLLYGANVDTSVVKGPFKGTQMSGFGWTINRNGVLSSYTNPLYFIGGDTINYTINY